MLSQIPVMLGATKNPNSALGAALEACHQLLEPTGGRLLVFQHTLPATGPMKLLQRDDVRQYGTDKEKALLLPLDEGWGKMAAKMAAARRRRPRTPAEP